MVPPEGHLKAASGVPGHRLAMLPSASDLFTRPPRTYERPNVPEFFANLGNIIWYMLTIIIFVSYLFAILAIIGDLFRDKELSGWWKAVWVFFLVFVPILTALIYLIARGSGMNKRAASQLRQSQAATNEYIRSVAGSPADEIARAKDLLDSGTINAEEFAALKGKALS